MHKQVAMLVKICSIAYQMCAIMKLNVFMTDPKEPKTTFKSTKKFTKTQKIIKSLIDNSKPSTKNGRENIYT